jgi:hypothetical protein
MKKSNTILLIESLKNYLILLNCILIKLIKEIETKKNLSPHNEDHL